MKKQLVYWASGLLLLSAACTREQFGEERQSGLNHPDEVNFEAGISDGAGYDSPSRVADAGWDNDEKHRDLKWIENDEIVIFSPESPTKVRAVKYQITGLSKEGGKEDSLGYLKKTDKDLALRWDYTTDTQHFYAVYPASLVKDASSITKENGDEHYLTCNIYPTQISNQSKGEAIEQDGIGGSWGVTHAKVFKPDYQKMVMYATEQKSPDASKREEPIHLKFKNVMTGFEINIPHSGDGTDEIAAVILKSNGCDIAGQFKLNLSNGAVETLNNDVAGNFITIPTTVIEGGKSVPVKLAKDQALRVTFFTLPIPEDREVTFDIMVVLYGKGIMMKRYKLVTGNGAASTAKQIYYENSKVNVVAMPRIRKTSTFQNWMSMLDPRTYLSQLSIPGSSNTFMSNGGNDLSASDITANSGVMKLYQVYDYESQFDKGARAFHIRVGLPKGQNGIPSIFAPKYKDNAGGYINDLLGSSAINGDITKVLNIYVGGSEEPKATLYDFLGKIKKKIEDANRIVDGKEWEGMHGNECALVYNNVYLWTAHNDANRPTELQVISKLVEDVLTKFDEQGGNRDKGKYIFRRPDDKQQLQNGVTLEDMRGKILFLANLATFPVTGNQKEILLSDYHYAAGLHGVYVGANAEADYASSRWNLTPESCNKIRNNQDITDQKTINDSDLDFNYLIGSPNYPNEYQEGIHGLSIWRQDLIRTKEINANVAWDYIAPYTKKLELAKDLFDKALKAEDTDNFNRYYINNLGGFITVDGPETDNKAKESWGKPYGASGNSVKLAGYINPAFAKYVFEKAQTHSAPFGVIFMNFLGSETVNGEYVGGKQLTDLIMVNNFAFPLKLRK